MPCHCRDCDVVPVWVDVLKALGLAAGVSLLLIVLVKFGLFALYPEPW